MNNSNNLHIIVPHKTFAFKEIQMETTLEIAEKEIKKWHSIASSASLLFAATLIIAGGTGLWLTSQNRSLKDGNEMMIQAAEASRKANEMITDELRNLEDKNKKNDWLIEKLEKDVFDMMIKAASLTAELEVLKNSNKPETD